MAWMKKTASSLDVAGCLSRYWFTWLFERNKKISFTSLSASGRRVSRLVLKIGKGEKFFTCSFKKLKVPQEQFPPCYHINWFSIFPGYQTTFIYGCAGCCRYRC